jgi:sulfite oxidase
MVTRKKREQLEVRGYALPPGHRAGRLARLEVSADGGRTWTAADLQGASQPYCWQFWTATLRQRKPAENVLVRAIDGDWRMQPEMPDWNLQGYLYNGWHSAAVEPAQQS